MTCRCPLSSLSLPNHLMMVTLVTAWEIKINWSWSRMMKAVMELFLSMTPYLQSDVYLEGCFIWRGWVCTWTQRRRLNINQGIATSSGFLIKQTRVIAITISIFHSWRLMDLVQNVLRYFNFELNMKMFCNQYPGLRWWVRVSRVEFGAMGQYHLAARLARAPALQIGQLLQIIITRCSITMHTTTKHINIICWVAPETDNHKEWHHISSSQRNTLLHLNVGEIKCVYTLKCRV